MHEHLVGAVIDVRVSTKEQTENLSLPTQLRACEESCRRHGYEILERFHEEGESAKTTDRTQLQALLKYCRTRKGKVHFVVVYNLTRFAREKYDHFALRAHLQSLGISLRSATEPIGDTSTGKLMEGVLAAFAQFDNDVRSDRTNFGEPKFRQLEPHSKSAQVPRRGSTARVKAAITSTARDRPRSDPRTGAAAHITDPGSARQRSIPLPARRTGRRPRFDQSTLIPTLPLALPTTIVRISRP
jgi:hypothetical protein